MSNGLGIIPELEAACALREGEYAVCYVNYRERILGASSVEGGAESARGPWSAFRRRHPSFDDRFFVGDIVTLAASNTDAGR